jgi:hypothetical protein
MSLLVGGDVCRAGGVSCSSIKGTGEVRYTILLYSVLAVGWVSPVCRGGIEVEVVEVEGGDRVLYTIVLCDLYCV